MREETMGKTAIIFSNNELESVRRIYPFVSDSSLDQIIWAIEGDESIPQFILSHSDKRNMIIHSKTRLGKSAAFNNAIKYVENDDVFLVSSDIVFEPKIFDDVATNSSGVGLSLTNVAPVKSDGFIRSLAALLWEIRNIQLKIFSENNIPIHGGEFLYMKKQFIEKIPEVVNDDAFQCILAQKNGAKSLYLSSITVKNFVPSNLIELINQRRRINYGHKEIGRILEKPSVISFTMFKKTGFKLKIFTRLFKNIKHRIFLLSFLLFIECISRIAAEIDIRSGHDQILWKSIDSSKS
ncbi:MAG: glycosyltransferase family 2 protein [Thermoplasmataceae archaeon]